MRSEPAGPSTSGTRPRPGATPSPTLSVQVIQALIARELVEGSGLPERRAAALLGLVTSSISQYLSGKRLGLALSPYASDPTARGIAREAAQRLLAGESGPRVVLDAAIQLGERLNGPAPSPGRPGPGGPSPELSRKLPGWLRGRVAGEQDAVAECMRLAQRSRDELTRALFRQIASDSLRHAEIVASLASYLDRGVASSAPTGVTRADVDGLIRRERAAESSGDLDLGPELGGMMRILWESMESDERKHERLLQLLRDAVLVEEEPASRATELPRADPAPRGRRVRAPRSPRGDRPVRRARR